MTSMSRVDDPVRLEMEVVTHTIEEVETRLGRHAE
jgi:hypothetical protein